MEVLQAAVATRIWRNELLYWGDDVVAAVVDWVLWALQGMNGGAAGGTFDVSILEVELENMWALVESPTAQQDLLKWGIPNSSSAQQKGVKRGSVAILSVLVTEKIEGKES
ncbi:hypothetical protein F0562_024115 [Nyssa sinensis]|uniref:Uncharacterized protein n=1 Tax=Nyssa sinensis TaxID=561372 RepID=A0A5J5BP62_9ASTE|nr:hypothetical protein F0562_024115 [Nyssa sinensis]